MNETRAPGRRLYKARRPDGEAAWVDHDELWRLQQGQAEELRRNQRRRRWMALLALSGLVALALAFVVFRLWPRAAAPPLGAGASLPAAAVGAPLAVTPPRAAAAAPGAGGERPAGAGEAAVLEATTDPRPPPSPADRIAGAVRAWAMAWARRDVPAYLASYATDFAPADGRSRASWESLRRQRLLTPASIRVELEELEVAPGAGGRAEARFLQRYSSPDYSDVVRKRLELVEEEGAWRIVSERVEEP